MLNALEGSACYIRSRDLLLSESDIDAYARQLGIAATKNDIRATHQKTNGWTVAVALYLENLREGFSERDAEGLDELLAASFWQKLTDAQQRAIAQVRSDMADNAYDLEGFLIRAFGRAIANAEEEAFIVGDGASKPTGLLHATLGGQIGVTTTGTAITADEVVDLIYKLKRPYRTNAAFLTADSTLAAIRKLKDSTNGTYLWQPALTAGEPDRLLGYPVYTSQFVPAVAAGKPVMAFGDFSYYNIGDRGTRSFAALHELYAGVGQVAFVAKERVDGKLILPEAVQVLKIKGTAAQG